MFRVAAARMEWEVPVSDWLGRWSFDDARNFCAGEDAVRAGDSVVVVFIAPRLMT